MYSPKQSSVGGDCQKHEGLLCRNHSLYILCAHAHREKGANETSKQFPLQRVIPEWNLITLDMKNSSIYFYVQ